MKKHKYDYAISAIKEAILKCQYDAVKSINEKQLILYFAIGKYVSVNSRNGHWGEGAIDSIGEQLEKEMPGLRGFSPRNIRAMRQFYEEWDFLENIQNNNLEPAGAKIDNQIIFADFIRDNYFPIREFLSIGFTLHRIIMSKIKNVDERVFYIKRTVSERYSRNELQDSIKRDDYHHQGNLPNNFKSSLSSPIQAFKAINTFKDEYLLDFVNVEEIDIRDKQDIDERIIENGIVNNIKKFILTFGKDFAFVGNQYHLDAFGVDQYIDLLFFNRELNCLVAVELKKGEFKTAYLGQLSGYLSILEKFEKKEHENSPIGIILCKDVNKSYADYVIQDYAKPMGISTYKNMSNEIRKCLPSVEEFIQIMEGKK